MGVKECWLGQIEMVKVFFFDWVGLYNECVDDFLQIVYQILLCGGFIFQKDVEEFEVNFVYYVGVKYVVGVLDGMNVILLGL